MTVLTLIPAKIRLTIYVVGGLIGLLLTAVQSGFAALHMLQPGWLTFAIGAYGVIGAALGLTAASNVPKDQLAANPPQPARH